MDISTITDPKELKALAYEQVVLIEQAQTNLRSLQQRLAQVEQEQLSAIETQEPTKTK